MSSPATTAFPHAVELLSGGAGIVVDHDDPDAMASALHRVLTQPRLAGSMASEARLLAPNGAGFAIAFHGILRAGATASTINLLYTADEVFMTGSAAELTPIGSVDGRVVGKPGEITRLLQDRFFAVCYGNIEEYSEWLTEI